MLPTRIFFLLLVLLNLALNGFALSQVHGGFVVHDAIVTVALVFNLLMLPLAVFAAYRMGGITEEIFREKAAREIAAAGEVARRQSEAARDAQPAGTAGSGALETPRPPARPVDDR